VPRGRTRRGRARSKRALLETPTAKPLLRGVDHGGEVHVDPGVVGATGDRWVEPFLDANRPLLTRLGVAPRVATKGGVRIALKPSGRIGAIPLLSPATRRVVAGLLISPRFRWSALGSVLSATGFSSEASLGGAPMVPGSAREVPSWLLAGPVLQRLEGLLLHRKRGFVERNEDRLSPRGRVNWAAWARRSVPTGRWTQLPCRFPDPDDDPELLAAVRWTLGRLEDELVHAQEAQPARHLLAKVAELQARAGPGVQRRPSMWDSPGTSGWLADAVQAMGWVAEERGLGGAKSLDGLSWDLVVDEVWEAWVDTFLAELAPRCGFVPMRRGRTRRRLNWHTSTASMGSLVPDAGMRGPGRLVWVDAKYKAHLQLIARRGWAGLKQGTREAHRADLHQALAYAALDDAEQVDSVLAYPVLASEGWNTPGIATVSAGRRRVRLLLAGLPFGFRSEDHKQATLTRWREMLAA